jgi:hypothetical protein
VNGHVYGSHSRARAIADDARWDSGTAADPRYLVQGKGLASRLGLSVSRPTHSNESLQSPFNPAMCFRALRSVIEIDARGARKRTLVESPNSDP